MKKEEIIKSLILGSISIPTGRKETIRGENYTHEREIYDTRAIVDIDKLVKFLSKYVVKESLIED